MYYLHPYHVHHVHIMCVQQQGMIWFMQVSAAVRKMQEEVEARQKAEAEAARLAEEQRIKVDNSLQPYTCGHTCTNVQICVICNNLLQCL